MDIYEFLSIDHINNDGAAHRRKLGSNYIYSWLIQTNFPEGFQVLCHNCNLAKGFYKQCPHQRERERNTMRVAANIDVNVFVLAGGYLYELSKDGIKAPAVTGPYGKGAAPKGSYRINPPIAIDPAAEENKGFVDQKGSAWFAALLPEFDTDRTGLGIHPDGGMPGTLGCVGIQLEDTALVKMALKRGGLLYIV